VQSYQLQHLPINFSYDKKDPHKCDYSCCCQIDFPIADVASKIHTDEATLSLRACCRLPASGRASSPACCALSAPSHEGELAAPCHGGELAVPSQRKGAKPSLRPPMEGSAPCPRAASHGRELSAPLVHRLLGAPSQGELAVLLPNRSRSCTRRCKSRRRQREGGDGTGKEVRDSDAQNFFLRKKNVVGFLVAVYTLAPRPSFVSA
jgi:hypothetical protein